MEHLATGLWRPVRAPAHDMPDAAVCALMTRELLKPSDKRLVFKQNVYQLMMLSTSVNSKHNKNSKARRRGF